MFINDGRSSMDNEKNNCSYIRGEKMNKGIKKMTMPCEKHEIPCKECLVLAACRNRDYVDCDLLFKWFKVSRGNSYRMRELKRYFGGNSYVFSIELRNGWLREE